MIFRVINFERYTKNKKPHSLTMDGVLDALKHSCLLYVRKWGGDANLAIFYLTTILYKNTLFIVKKKR
jgi:hypothetical protein